MPENIQILKKILRKLKKCIKYLNIHISKSKFQIKIFAATKIKIILITFLIISNLSQLDLHKNSIIFFVPEKIHKIFVLQRIFHYVMTRKSFPEIEFDVCWRLELFLAVMNQKLYDSTTDLIFSS